MFTSDTDMTISPRHTIGGQLQYSTDKINWNNISTGGTTSSSKVIYFRGKMDSSPKRLFAGNGGSSGSDNIWKFNNATNLNIKGNLNTLLDYENSPSTIDGYCYYRMFKDCTSLTDISELKLPATIFEGSFSSKKYFYAEMFNGCTKLTTIPSDLLPAITLEAHCYREMFCNCTSLVVNTESSTGYSRTFRIPSSETGTDTAPGTNTSGMFTNTAGTMNNTPVINTIYYIKDLE